MAGSTSNPITRDNESEEISDNTSFDGESDSDWVEERNPEMTSSRAKRKMMTKSVSKSAKKLSTHSRRGRRRKQGSGSPLKLPSARSERDILQFSQQIGFSQESLSSQGQSSSGTSSSCSSGPQVPTLSYFCPAQEVPFVAGPTVLVQIDDCVVETYGPLPFVLAEPDKITNEDIGNTLYTANMILPLETESRCVMTKKSVTVVFVKSLDEMLNWSGPLPSIVYCLGYLHTNETVRKHFIYLGHKFIHQMVTSKMAKSRDHKPILVACVACLRDKLYKQLLVTIRERTAITFVTHCAKRHRDNPWVNDILDRSFLTSKGSMKTAVESPTVPPNNLTCEMQLRLVADLIVSKLLSFVIVEAPAFRDLQKAYNPTALYFHRHQVANYIHKEVDILDLRLRDRFAKEASACCIMSDAWTSARNEGVLATALTYVDTNFRLQHVMLGMQRVLGAHTGINLANKMKELLVKFGITSQHVFSLTDGGANMLKAMREIENSRLPENSCELNMEDRLNQSFSATTGAEELTGHCSDDEATSQGMGGPSTTVIGVRPIIEDILVDAHREVTTSQTHIVRIHAQHICVAHSLQSCIRSAVEDPRNVWIRTAIVYSTVLIKCFRKRVHMCDSLKQLAGKGLVAPVKTRWNSHVDSLIRLTEPKVFESVVAILSFEHNHGNNSAKLPAVPTEDDYILFQNIIRVLASFSTATDRLQRDTISIHEVLPEIVHVYHSLKMVPGAVGDVVTTFRDTLMEQVLYRFTNLFNAELYLGGMIFSPRRKLYLQRYHKVFPDNPFRAPSHDEAVILVKAVLPTRLTSVTVPMNIVPSSLSDDESESVFDTYMQMSTGNEDLREFWLRSQTVLPGLSDMARFFLCVPATTATVERYFSSAGLICSKLRCRMTVDTMSAILRYRLEKMRDIDVPTEPKPRQHIPLCYVLQYVDGQRTYKPYHNYDARRIEEAISAYAASRVTK